MWYLTRYMADDRATWGYGRGTDGMEPPIVAAIIAGSIAVALKIYEVNQGNRRPASPPIPAIQVVRKEGKIKRKEGKIKIVHEHAPAPPQRRSGRGFGWLSILLAVTAVGFFAISPTAQGWVNGELSNGSRGSITPAATTSTSASALPSASSTKLPEVSIEDRAQAIINDYNSLLISSRPSRDHTGFDKYFEPTIRWFTKPTPRDTVIESFFGTAGATPKVILEPAKIQQMCSDDGTTVKFSTIVQYRPVGAPQSANRLEPTVYMFHRSPDGSLRISGMGRGDCSNT